MQSRMSGRQHSVSSPDISSRNTAANTSRSLTNKSSSSRGLRAGEPNTSSFLCDISTAGGGGFGNTNNISLSKISNNNSRRSKLPLSTNFRKSGSSSRLSDRYIPMRLSGSQASLQSYILKKAGGEASIPGIEDDSPRTQENKRMLSRAIISNTSVSDAGANHNSSNVASGRSDGPVNIINYRRGGGTNDTTAGSGSSYIQQHPAKAAHMPISHKAANYRSNVPSQPSHVLDAPQIWNNFYINILDWGSDAVLAVALNSVLYTWNAVTNEIVLKVDLDPNSDTEIAISSCRWMMGGSCIALGTTANEVLLYDVVKEKKLRALRGHTDRVSSLAWNSWLLANGSKSGALFLSDVRAPEHLIAQLQGHQPQHEICGLTWSGGTSPRYLASGANDNTVQIWSSPMVPGGKTVCPSNDPATPRKSLYRFTDHVAAVKALAFCPWHENLLATGGGSADCTIKLWNLNSGKLVKSVFADAPVAGIIWSEQYKEIISGHGSKIHSSSSVHNSAAELTPPTDNNNNESASASNTEFGADISLRKNPITLWKYPSMDKMRELYGHADRVLALSVNPEQTIVASAGADETIRMWDVWPKAVAVDMTVPNDDGGFNSQGSKTIRNASDDVGKENGLLAAFGTSFSKMNIR